MKPLLNVQGLEIRSATAQLVAPISLALWPGQVLTIIGETGSGKSLFAQGVVGNLPPGLQAHGQIELANGLREQGTDLARRQLWGREIAVLPQEPWLSLDPTMRALSQVSETYRHVLGKPEREAARLGGESLAGLGLEQARDKYPFQLSGGMAQRLAFAATHAGGAKVMIADEPTKGLDSARIGEVVALLQAGLADGGALLIITHDIEVARQLGGEVMIMLKGQVVESGPAEQVLNRPVHDYSRLLMAANPARWPRRPAQPLGPPVVQVRDLGAERGGRRLFEGLSLAIGAGEVVGVTGPSGCGKSTLGDIILGLIAPGEGSVQRQAGLPRVAMQKLFQDPVAAFPPTLTLGRNLDDLLRLHRLEAGQIPRLMQRLRLAPELLQRRPGQVSGGELQRFSLLRVLLLKPVFIFADEPSSRLDMITQKEMIDLLLEMAREYQTAVLLVSHDVALIEAVADRHLRLDAVAQHSPSERQLEAHSKACSV